MSGFKITTKNYLVNTNGSVVLAKSWKGVIAWELPNKRQVIIINLIMILIKLFTKFFYGYCY